jgi:hypothetical protein
MKLNSTLDAKPLKVLVDNGAVSAASFLIPAQRAQELKWGDQAAHLAIAGFVRTPIAKDAEQQAEKDALFTIGRLARAGRVSLFTYVELSAEQWRGSLRREPFVNAFAGHKANQCHAPIERTKFRAGLGFDEWMAKGGKKDRKQDRASNDLGQIPFLSWLASLSDAHTNALMGIAAKLRLTEFEVDSLRDLGWFQALAKELGSQENLPDCFHIWTARRNNIPVFLTLEKTLPRRIEQIQNRRQQALEIDVAVLRPSALMLRLGITELDTVPLEPERVYSVGEVEEINRKLLET